MILHVLAAGAILVPVFKYNHDILNQFIFLPNIFHAKPDHLTGTICHSGALEAVTIAIQF